MKAILVMDMPENCECCECLSLIDMHDRNTAFCTGSGLENHNASVRPGWCPLKPLPERRRIEDVSSEYEDGVTAGWNACIDAIEGMAK